MDLFITPLYASVFAIVYVLLSLHVIHLRGTHHVALGDGGHPPLTRAIAAHANFSQYVPLFLVLLLLMELGEFSHHLLLLIGFLMLFGRVLHAYSVLVYESAHAGQGDALRLRKTGMVATFAALTIAALMQLSVVLL